MRNSFSCLLSAHFVFSEWCASIGRTDDLAHVAPDDLLRGAVENLAEPVIGFRQAVVGGGDDADAVARVLEERPVALLALD